MQSEQCTSFTQILKCCITQVQDFQQSSLLNLPFPTRNPDRKEVLVVRAHIGSDTTRAQAPSPIPASCGSNAVLWIHNLYTFSHSGFYGWVWFFSLVSFVLTITNFAHLHLSVPRFPTCIPSLGHKARQLMHLLPH